MLTFTTTLIGFILFIISTTYAAMVLNMCRDGDWCTMAKWRGCLTYLITFSWLTLSLYIGGEDAPLSVRYIQGIMGALTIVSFLIWVWTLSHLKER